MTRYSVLLAGLLLLSTPARAVDPPAWVGPANITEISVQPNGRLLVKVDVSTPDLGCTGNLDGWLEMNPAYPYFKEQYALLLTAHTAGRQVKIYVNGCGWYPYAQNSNLF